MKNLEKLFKALSIFLKTHMGRKQAFYGKIFRMFLTLVTIHEKITIHLKQTLFDCSPTNPKLLKTLIM